MKSEWFASSPVTINWAITNKCNFCCRHCYSRADVSEELGRGVLLEIVGKLSEAGVFSLNFGGGEPLLSRDILETAEAASGLGLNVSMNSNGYLINEKTALDLKKAGFKKVGISIDSPVASVHDEFRGVKGCHEKAVAALGHLNAAGIETSISSVICRINVNDIDGLIALARSLDVSHLNFHNFKCSGLGFANKDELDLTPAEWKEFYIHVSEIKDKIGDLHISLEDPIIASLGHRDSGSLVKGSVCGKLSLNIKSNGDITPCGFIPVVIGNILKDDLRDIWYNSPVLKKMRAKTPRGKCAGCGHYSECLGGCTARALALTGDINSPDPHCWYDGS